MNGVIVTAHSGCEGTPRDSLESVFQAVQCGADAVEVDVRMDERGVLRISHDHKKTLEEYARCNTLQEVFAAVAQTPLRVNCDMKEAELAHEVIALAQAYGLGRERLWMTGAISPEQLVREPALRDQVTFFVNIEEIFKFQYLQENAEFPFTEFGTLMNVPWTYTREWMEFITPERVRRAAVLYRAIGADGINIPQWNLTEELFGAFAEAEIPLSIWTVDEENAARRILTQKVSSVRNITTRQVRMVQRVRDEVLGADPG